MWTNVDKWTNGQMDKWTNGHMWTNFSYGVLWQYLKLS